MIRLLLPAAFAAGLGLILLMKDRPRDAVLAFRIAAKLEPANVQFRQNLAVALEAAGERQEAAELLEQILAGDPSLEVARHLLARIYGGMGQKDRRRATLERYLEFQPRSLVARELLSNPALLR